MSWIRNTGNFSVGPLTEGDFLLESLLVCCLHVGAGSEAHSQLQAAWHLFYPRIGQPYNCLSFNMKGVGGRTNNLYTPLAIPVFSLCCGTGTVGSWDSDLGRPNISIKKKRKKKILYLEELFLCFLWRAEASSVPPSCIV
jgi:hypothetical protein